eukprot:jgi/Astpho2/7311/fgenesh1_pg.00113_%23_106_t
MQAHAEETFTLALLPALLQYRPAARPLRCKGDAAAGRVGRDGAWPASQGPGTKGGCRGQGHGGRHQKPSATTRWGLLHSDTLAVLSLGESEGSGDNGPGGVVDGSAMGFQEEQDGCQRMRHWWQHSQLLEVGPHVAGNVSRSERGAVPPDLPDRDFNMITDSFNKLMEELAQVEQTAQDEAGPPRSDSAGDLHSDAAPGTSPGDQNLAATLQALAKQTQSLHRNTRVPQDSGNMLDPAQLTRAAGAGPISMVMAPAQLMRLAAQMEALGGGGEVDPNMPLPEGVSGFMNDLMQSLLSKDVLYGSIKEIGDKYPQWLQDHRDTLSALELERYERQHQHIRDICHLYETDPNNFTRLVDLLQQMQACGSPPKDIVDELAPGLEMGADGLPKMPGDAASACCIQ